MRALVGGEGGLLQVGGWWLSLKAYIMHCSRILVNEVIGEPLPTPPPPLSHLGCLSLHFLHSNFQI